MTFSPAPDWMAEQLPFLATGHADGTIRWWHLREPSISVGRNLPYSYSIPPVGGTVQPAWEIAELVAGRLAVPGNELVLALRVDAEVCWCGTASGRVFKWLAPLQS
eukprot:6181228-Pleurochrysis_carterae.AAC.4